MSNPATPATLEPRDALYLYKSIVDAAKNEQARHSIVTLKRHAIRSHVGPPELRQ